MERSDIKVRPPAPTSPLIIIPRLCARAVYIQRNFAERADAIERRRLELSAGDRSEYYGGAVAE